MPANFLHGVETIENQSGPVPIQVVRSAVIGLVGTAPTWSAPGALQRWNLKWAVLVGQQILDSNGNVQQCTVAGTTGASTEPTWGTALNAITAADGGATWKLVKLAATLGLHAPTLIGDSSQNSQFGALIRGYTIPYALAAIQAQGAGQVIVVNVFDPIAHVTTITAAAMSFPGSGPQVLNLGHMGVSNVKITNAGGSTTYIRDTDFSIDPVNGTVTAIGGGAITSGEAILATFNYADPTQISTDSPIIGTISAGVYTGIQAFLTCWQNFGFWPKILIAPGFSQNADVAAALDTLAFTVRAMALVDSAPSTLPATAIANRSVLSNAFSAGDKRTILCFPQQQFTDNGVVPTGVTLSAAGLPVQQVFGANAVEPYTPIVAGVMASTDINLGYWFSPSNNGKLGTATIIGSLGPDVAMYLSFIDQNADNQLLNAAGIVTVFSGFGTGLRVWGNRSAAFPASTAPDQFISIRRTLDVIEESVQFAMLQFLDLPISNALIDSILATANAFIRSLIQKGALVTGSAVTFNPALNPGAQVINGQLVFSYDILPPPPLERITNDFFADPSLAANIGADAAAGLQLAA
jgi:phage tail sheath protein FI